MAKQQENSTVMVTEKELKTPDFTKFTASTKTVAMFYQQVSNALKVHCMTNALEAPRSRLPSSKTIRMAVARIQPA